MLDLVAYGTARLYPTEAAVAGGDFRLLDSSLPLGDIFLLSTLMLLLLVETEGEPFLHLSLNVLGRLDSCTIQSV